MRLVGRFAGARFAWSASSIVVRFTGSASATLRLKVPVLPPHTVTIDGKAVRLDEKLVAYSVFVDDRAPKLVKVSPDRERYELAKELDPSATHEIRIVREPEAFAGVHEFLGVELAEGGRMLEPAPPSRRIEFLGDSIMCGYGVLGKDASCPFTYETERATAAYPFLAARAIGADATVMCWSGRGVFRNFDGSTEETMPVLYERTLPEPPGTAYPFADPPPDTVFIALGTNDFFGGQGKPLSIGAFEEAYVKLLRRVRERRPSARIVIATSPMVGPPLRAKLGAALEHVAAARRAEGETRLALLDLEYEGDRVGCDGHPNVEMQAILAKSVEAALRER